MCAAKMYDILFNYSEFYIAFRHGGLAPIKAFVNGIKILFSFLQKLSQFNAHFNRFFIHWRLDVP